MANMFSGNREKEIPQTFKDCYKTDSVTKNLWAWCERLEKWGEILFCIISIGGILLSIISLISVETVTKEIYPYTDTKISFDFISFILTLLTTALLAFLEYILYHAIALLIGSLASIVQHTKITANIALYKFATENNIVTDTNSTNDKLSKIISGKTSNNVIKKICPHCGNPIKSKVCDMCGKENNLF